MQQDVAVGVDSVGVAVSSELNRGAEKGKTGGKKDYTTNRKRTNDTKLS
jgi:hypothetical protein